MMQQNRDRNGRPRNTRPYDLNRDVARTSTPSQDHTPPSRSAARLPAAPTAACAPPGQITASSSPPSPRPAARRRGREAIPPSTPLAAARRAADPKTRSLAANSAARQTMPAAGRTAGKTRTRKTIRTGSTRQPARISACAQRKAPRSKALPGGKCAKSAR